LLQSRQEELTEFYNRLDFDGNKGLFKEIEEEMRKRGKKIAFDLIAQE
jgi:hypothetical protein